MKLSVIIPAYNEEKRLSETLIHTGDYLQAQKYESEIIVVNDGSTDRTGELVEEMKKEIVGLKLINNVKNHGKGYVVRQGMLRARGEYCLFMDADNATKIESIELAWPKLSAGADVVIGTRDSRDLPNAGQKVPQPLWKRVLGDVGNLLIQFLLIPNIWDTQCGFKVFSSAAAKSIFSKTKIDRWAFDVEALSLARALKYKIDLIPVSWVNDSNSKVKITGYIRSLYEVFTIKYYLLKNVYRL